MLTRQMRRNGCSSSRKSRRWLETRCLCLARIICTSKIMKMAFATNQPSMRSKWWLTSAYLSVSCVLSAGEHSWPRWPASEAQNKSATPACSACSSWSCGPVHTSSGTTSIIWTITTFVACVISASQHITQTRPRNFKQSRELAWVPWSLSLCPLKSAHQVGVSNQAII